MAGAPFRWRCSGYAGVLLFKLLRVPAGRWTITTAALEGVVTAGVLLLAMNYNYSFATEARLHDFTTLTRSCPLV